MASHSPVRGMLLFAGLVLLAGCLGFVTGTEPLTFTASEATVDEATLSNTGYELQERQTIPLNRTVELQGQQRRIEITNHVVTYSKSVQGVPAGIAVVFSTPQAQAFGQALNPLGQLSERELLERTSSQASGGVQGIQLDSSRTATILGVETEVKRFSATVQRNSQRVDVWVYVTRVGHNGDFVIGSVIVPQDIPNGDSDAMTLLRGIKH